MAERHSVSRDMQRALDILSDHEQRVSRVYERRREHRRQPVNKLLHVMSRNQRAYDAIEVYSYDVSRSGIGFICEEPLEPGPIRICLDPQSAAPIWMDAVVCQCKEVTDGIYACGTRFQNRVPSAGSSIPVAAAEH